MPQQPELINERSSSESSARDAEREAYLERLRERLHDPDFRAIEGFPIGEDEDILALSDPPYYTACPHPFLPEIIERWREEREASSVMRHSSGDASRVTEDDYHREPFATDVSEGKSGYVYTAHSYHTKVPHKAIMRYLLHYTDPGDVVFDGFCGTGMTGVAAQLCGDLQEVQGLGYRVGDDGIVRAGTEAVSRLGPRKAVLVDLSPAATFIAHNYNTPVDTPTFRREAQRILDEVQEEIGWMYETRHDPSGENSSEVGGARHGAPVRRVETEHGQRVRGRISYTVWSEILICPQCSGEVIFYEAALDEDGRVKKTFECRHCGAAVTKNSLERHYVTQFDPVLGRPVRTLKRMPVMIEYKVGRTKYQKRPDEHDLEIIERVEALPMPVGFPTKEIPFMHMTHQRAVMENYGVTHLHHFFLPRARHVLSLLWSKASAIADPRLRSFMLFTVEQAIWGMSLLERYTPTHYSQVNQYLSGVYYISSHIAEVSPWYILRGKVKRLTSAFAGFQTQTGHVSIATQSATIPPALESSVDYIFTDPPFGENIYYADLNYLVESWHRVWTESEAEAIVDQAKEKTLQDYQNLMREAFVQFYDWLKPGRWMTVVFHNSHNAVWNAIQEALLSAGFMVADVRTLDKKSKSYRQVTASSAAKQDLVISAYKPRTGFEQRFLERSGTAEGAWDFVRQHLAQLPVVVRLNGQLETLAERQDYLLFDRMVAFHIQRGATVPLSAAEFYAGLRERFIERDGMFFLPDQVTEYDRTRLDAESVAQLSLFVDDEKSAIQWLRQQLDPQVGGQPQTYQELQPQFLRQLHQASHEELPELSVVLEQNFLQDEADRWYAPDPNKASDLEKLRRKTLLREFKEYVKKSGRLRKFRTEAVRAGFADAWQRNDYETIIQVAERLPQRVLQEDADLLMYYDNASLRASCVMRYPSCVIRHP
ncbi:MAG TPA: DNA methylase [Chloroflexi bacterium]|nr:DNA methylase [Chloroflexota bacterium]